MTRLLRASINAGLTARFLLFYRVRRFWRRRVLFRFSQHPEALVRMPPRHIGLQICYGNAPRESHLGSLRRPAGCLGRTSPGEQHGTLPLAGPRPDALFRGPTALCVSTISGATSIAVFRLPVQPAMLLLP
jgi:hypothetical protein